MSRNQEIRNKIIEILGLEVPPNGNEHQNAWLLIRDEKGKVLEGTDYGDEVDEIVKYVEAILNAKINQI